ncbi:MAG: 50S ribosomal protein L13 [Chloroflexi bacterium]|nr:50S ribosomal protein L13 [Chloroflexota bacterium]
MRAIIPKTYTPKEADLKPSWRVIDASNRPLGRLASEVAQLLRGKHNPGFATHQPTGDFVIVINASHVAITGNKESQKMYYRHSGYPGGLKAINYKQYTAKSPERIIEPAVKGMLPHNRLGALLLRRMKVYAGPTHPHEAQVVGAQRAAEAAQAAAEQA